MKVLSYGDDRFIAEVSKHEMANLLGLNFWGSYSDGKDDPKSLIGKSLDIKNLDEAIRKAENITSSASKIIKELKELTPKLESTFFPLISKNKADG